jgi:hypothetical protein
MSLSQSLSLSFSSKNLNNKSPWVRIKVRFVSCDCPHSVFSDGTRVCRVSCVSCGKVVRDGPADGVGGA